MPVVKLSSYQLLTAGLGKEQALPVLQGVAEQADITAREGLAAAEAARAAADAKTTTFYASSAPTATGVGDLWFDTTDLGGGRMSYRPKTWTGSAWVLVAAPALLVASDIAAGAITTDRLEASCIKTSNFASTGSGTSEVATAGAKMQTDGTALLVAPGNLKVGSTLLSDAWFANAAPRLRHLSVTTGTLTGTGVYFNADHDLAVLVPFVTTNVWGFATMGYGTAAGLSLIAGSVQVATRDAFGDPTAYEYPFYLCNNGVRVAADGATRTYTANLMLFVEGSGGALGGLA